MSTLSGTLTILSAMFTPAVLVSACGSLILTTSQRLSRSLDRQREVAGQLRQPADAAEHTHLAAQLFFAARRAQVLQQVMTGLHLALGIFIASIFTIGIFELLDNSASWIIALLSVAGTALLFYASVLLIKESRLAVSDVAEETKYLTGLVGTPAAAE